MAMPPPKVITPILGKTRKRSRYSFIVRLSGESETKSASLYPFRGKRARREAACQGNVQNIGWELLNFQNGLQVAGHSAVLQKRSREADAPFSRTSA